MLQSIIMPIENFLSLIQNLWFQPLLLISTHSLTCPVTIMLLKYPLHALVTVTSLNYSDHPLTSSMRLNCNHDQHIIELQDSLSSCMMIKCPLSDRTLNCAHHMACDLTCAVLRTDSERTVRMLIVRIWERGKRVPVLEPLTLMDPPTRNLWRRASNTVDGECTNTDDLSNRQVRQLAALVALVVHILVLGFDCI